jgi:hypothetical protein
MSEKNVFVFVVCGENKHIEVLNFSIKYLRRFSQNQILVVTDSRRNSIKIDHNNILDIETPAHLDHHQASIFLKTGLHKFLDLSANYCYLDSDVIALTPNVDKIFNYQYGPVTFAADHCRVNEFSPYAVNCGCLEKKNNDQQAFVEVVKKVIPDYEYDAFYKIKKGRELDRLLTEIKENPFKNLQLLYKFLMVFYLKKANCQIELENGFKYNSEKNGWIDSDRNVVMQSLFPISKKIKATSEFSFDVKKMIWVNKNRESVSYRNCNHLIEEIRHKFKINIKKKNFQHWNGGVFLFNNKSVDFLETWHQHTMDIFKDKSWKTRDQGTLAATVWQFGLQDQKTLPVEFNFIADFFNTQITYQDDKGFTQNNFKSILKPDFIHVYHEFGNSNWDIWMAIEKLLNENK